MSKILVSLVSEQTIPNVELIKEFKNDIDQLLFITTARMEANGQDQWIIDAADARNIPLHKIVVNAFEPSDILAKLNAYPFSQDDEYIVNITGGTKLMSLMVHSFFQNLAHTQIYYVTGQNKVYLKLYPIEEGNGHLTMQHRITLDEYLKAYGFEIKKSAQTCAYSHDYIEHFLQKFMEAEDYHFEAIGNLRNLRNKARKKTVEIYDPQIGEFLDDFDFIPKIKGSLTKSEINFLTGEWFEWLTYYRVKNDLQLDAAQIGLGYKLFKGTVDNELDVLFVHNNKLYTIECKTGITAREYTPDGKEKIRNLLSEIVYKSDSLQNKLGLFVNASVFILSEIYQEDGVTPIQNLKPGLERAQQMNINVFGRKDILSGKTVRELLNIQ